MTEKHNLFTILGLAIIGLGALLLFLKAEECSGLAHQCRSKNI
ncbi:MAG: LPXTG cell wall anchor domain-containing protein [Candidatus Melainabacteria bacterium]|nr:LPXTG cell wall anchor domain-containing protein [Candidatus Melainabacteria bacterium]